MEMKLVILGMTGRPLTYSVIKEIATSGYDLEMVILQNRFANRGNLVQFFWKSLKKHGFRFILQRLREIKKKKKNDEKKLCSKHQIPLITIDDINSQKVEEQLTKIKPDVIILAGPPIIKENIFSQSRKFTINVHRGILPKYAGLDAIFWALYNNESEIGATVHVVTKGIDAGDIIAQRKRPVRKSDNLETLTDWYYEIAPALILESLVKIRNEVKFIKQNKSERGYYSWPTKEQRKELAARLLKT